MWNLIMILSPLFFVTTMIWWKPEGTDQPNRYRAVKAGHAQWLTSPVSYTRK